MSCQLFPVLMSAWTRMAKAIAKGMRLATKIRQPHPARSDCDPSCCSAVRLDRTLGKGVGPDGAAADRLPPNPIKSDKNQPANPTRVSPIEKPSGSLPNSICHTKSDNSVCAPPVMAIRISELLAPFKTSMIALFQLTGIEYSQTYRLGAHTECVEVVHTCILPHSMDAAQSAKWCDLLFHPLQV